MTDPSTATAFLQHDETSLDPGWSLIVGTLVTCMLLCLSLPCVVSLGSRYERRRDLHWFRRNRTIRNDGYDYEDERISRSSSTEEMVLIIDDIDKALSARSDQDDETTSDDDDDQISTANRSEMALATTSMGDWFAGIIETVRMHVVP